MKDRDLSDKCYFCVTTVRALTLRNVTAQVSGIRILLRCVPDDNLNQYTSIASQPSQSTFTPTYDADGNQTLVKTKTGIWQVEYNGENRPVKWTCGATSLVMAFDRMGRRVLCEVRVNDTPIKTETFVYDGYTCILRQTTIHTNATPTVVRDTFIWDPTEPVATRPLVWQREGSETAFYFHDGNKNVSDVVSASGEVLAHYTYAPFGDCTATGSLAEANPWRFSSEYADDEIGCVYYNFRHYEPTMGRWLNRDLYNDLAPLLDIMISLDSNRKKYVRFDLEHHLQEYNNYLFVDNNFLKYCDIFGLLASSGDIDWGKGNSSKGNCWRYAWGIVGTVPNLSIKKYQILLNIDMYRKFKGME